MELHEKLQELRKQKGLTQEELARHLFVSRTAISKWESGRGYPNIESLKAIAKFFSVTVDELLSPDQILTIAEENQRRTEKQLCDLVFGFSDLCMSLLLFLPFFATRANETIQGASLLTLEGVATYVKIAYLTVVTAMTVMGIVTLALQSCRSVAWGKSKGPISLALSVIAVLLFIVSLQPYAAALAFSWLVIKTLLLLKRQ